METTESSLLRERLKTATHGLTNYLKPQAPNFSPSCHTRPAGLVRDVHATHLRHEPLQNGHGF